MSGGRWSVCSSTNCIRGLIALLAQGDLSGMVGELNPAKGSSMIHRYRFRCFILALSLLAPPTLNAAPEVSATQGVTAPGTYVDPQITYSQSSRGPARALVVHSSPYRVYSHPSAVTALAFDMAGKVLASGDAQGHVRLWPLGSEELVVTLDAHRRGVKTLAFHPDGSTLASGGGDSLVHVWNIREVRTQAWLDYKHRGPVSVVAFSPDGTRMLSGGQDDSIVVRDVVTGQKLTTFFGHSADISALVMSPESDCVVSGGADRSLQGWDLASAEQLDFSTQPARVTALALARDGSRLATALSDGLITLRRTSNCRVHTIALRLAYHTQSVRSMVFSPDSRFLYSAGADRQIVKWDVEAGIPVEIYQGHVDEIQALAISPDGALLASGGRDHAVRIWKLAPTDAFNVAPVAIPGPPARAISSTRPLVPPRAVPTPPPAPPVMTEPAGPSPD